jgi:hypothetical protein
MRFAVPYFRKDGGKWMAAANEIIIKYKDEDESALVDFIKNHPSQRIIIQIEDIYRFKRNSAINKYIFSKLKEEYKLTNWAVEFCAGREEITVMETWLKDTELIDKIPYFYSFTPQNYEQLDRLIHLNVTDIYIVGYLAFDIINVRRMINKKAKIHKNIRLIPNLCQSYWTDELSLSSFFIRPEDVELYEDYVDVMEIYAANLAQIEYADVYFDIYSKSGTWMGDLKEYLLDCNESINNIYIWKDFGERRLKCKKRCRADGSCNFCEQQREYIHLMERTMDKIGHIDSQVEEQEERETIIEDENIYEYIGEEAIDIT